MDNEDISVTIVSSKENNITSIQIYGLSPLMAHRIADMSRDEQSELNKKIAEILQREVRVPLSVRVDGKEV
jgi:hypothetical protein